MLTKKMIIISIAAIIGLAGLVVGGLSLYSWLSKKDTVTSAPTTPKPGDVVALEKTPDYKTCDIIPLEKIQSILGDNATSIKAGIRSGVIAKNYETAEVCDFNFTSSASDKNTITLESYLYSPNADIQEGNDYNGGAWRNITKAFFPSYQLDYPAYFQTIESDGIKAFVLQVVLPAKNFRFIIEQPASAVSIKEDAAIEILIKLANEANYTVTNNTNAPPAPTN